MEVITLDKDIIDFLRAIYFGAYKNPYKAACNRAYLDMNRTIRFQGMKHSDREKLRETISIMMEDEIKILCGLQEVDQKTYDDWHFEMCDRIRKIYRNAGVDFFYGQSQKWVNMTMKYLYIIGECTFEKIFDFLHAPLDNYIFTVAQKELGIKKLNLAWSRWDDYKGQYMFYENALREKIMTESLLRWEFKYWLLEARFL